MENKDLLKQCLDDAHDMFLDTKLYKSMNDVSRDIMFSEICKRGTTLFINGVKSSPKTKPSAKQKNFLISIMRQERGHTLNAEAQAWLMDQMESRKMNNIEALVNTFSMEEASKAIDFLMNNKRIEA